MGAQLEGEASRRLLTLGASDNPIPDLSLKAVQQRAAAALTSCSLIFFGLKEIHRICGY
jgi:hypothetical protein